MTEQDRVTLRYEPEPTYLDGIESVSVSTDGGARWTECNFTFDPARKAVRVEMPTEEYTCHQCDVPYGTYQHECCVCGEFEECAYVNDQCEQDEVGWSFRAGRFYCKDCADERF